MNCAQYMHSYSIKDEKGKNLRYPEGIFGIFLNFGRDKTEILVKIEGCNDRDSESPVPGSINKGKCKKDAKNVPKFVIISIRYAINLIFLRALRISNRTSSR